MRILFTFLFTISLSTFSFAASADTAPGKPLKQPNYMGRLVKTIRPDRSIYYKTVGEKALRMDIFDTGGNTNTPRPCFVGIHGGGWTNGGPATMYAYCQWAARQGMLAVSIQYRRFRKDPGVTVFDCVRFDAGF